MARYYIVDQGAREIAGKPVAQGETTIELSPQAARFYLANRVISESPYYVDARRTVLPTNISSTIMLFGAGEPTSNIGETDQVYYDFDARFLYVKGPGGWGFAGEVELPQVGFYSTVMSAVMGI